MQSRPTLRRLSRLLMPHQRFPPRSSLSSPPTPNSALSRPLSAHPLARAPPANSHQRAVREKLRIPNTAPIEVPHTRACSSTPQPPNTDHKLSQRAASPGSVQRVSEKGATCRGCTAWLVRGQLSVRPACAARAQGPRPERGMRSSRQPPAIASPVTIAFRAADRRLT